jgi:hypothetical protein
MNAAVPAQSSATLGLCWPRRPIRQSLCSHASQHHGSPGFAEAVVAALRIAVTHVEWKVAPQALQRTIFPADASPHRLHRPTSPASGPQPSGGSNTGRRV